MESTATSWRFTDYLRDLLVRLSAIDIDVAAQRRLVFQAALADFEDVASNLSAILDAEDVEVQRRMLRLTTRLIEQDIRSGIAILQEGYEPEQLADAQQKYDAATERRSFQRQIVQAKERRSAARASNLPFGFADEACGRSGLANGSSSSFTVSVSGGAYAGERRVGADGRNVPANLLLSLRNGRNALREGPGARIGLQLHA